MKKVSPVLRYPGSKFKKIDKILSFIPKETKTFIDMFGGSGIVGVNVKQLLKINVIINDYDNIFPIKDGFAVKNMCSFAGIGKSYTKSANDYFLRRIKNGYWDKLDFYNGMLEKCKIMKNDYSTILGENWDKNKKNVFVYVDPPYYNVKGLYKKDFQKADHIKLKRLLETFSSLGYKILLSYNNETFVKNLYKDWKIMEEDFTYTSGMIDKNKTTKELFISNERG